MFSKKEKQEDLSLEESLGEEWSREYDIREVAVGVRPFVFAAAAAFAIGSLFVGRIFYLATFRGEFYRARAAANETQLERIPAPRGLIYDRGGKVLAANEPVFTAILDVREFLKRKDLEYETLKAIEDILYLPPSEVWKRIKESSKSDFVTPIVLEENLTQAQLVKFEALNLSTISVKRNFIRKYFGGPVYSSVVGYVGRVAAEDLERDPSLGGEDFVGKAGVEFFYDNEIRGRAGIVERRRDVKGKVLSEETKSEPEIGKSLRLTIDGEFQDYFYWRMRQGLAALGRRVGVGIALDPRNGEVLALVNVPGYDPNILASSGRNEKKMAILNSPDKPLFNRAVGGAYNPGSTIKPLVALAALKEKVITSTRKIFSPGYIDIQNPYNPGEFTRYRDWRYQGSVDLSSALAQSSNVYFYVAGGGAPQGVDPQILAGGGYVSGLGINRLYKWWEKFLLGKRTGIDLPGEAEGFLPTPAWKEEKTGRPWLLGDTYNVAIGQGDLLLTPIQLLNYISAIANGGKIYQPTVNLDREHPKLLADLSELSPEIFEVRKGMEEAVTSPLGTAHLLNDLGFKVAAKTGTAEVRSKQDENAFFVGYLPAEVLTKAGLPNEGSPLAILVLVENSVEGSLNTVPIAKDVLNWYYWNRIRRPPAKGEIHLDTFGVAG